VCWDGDCLSITLEKESVGERQRKRDEGEGERGRESEIKGEEGDEMLPTEQNTLEIRKLNMHVYTCSRK
jgi:hypothetical protein